MMPRFLHIGFRYLLAIVYMISALSKTMNPSKFFSFIERLPFASSLNPLVWLIAVVSVEIGFSILFLFPRFTRMAAISSFITLCLFSVVLAYASVADLDSACGCFGDVLETAPEIAIIRNIILLLLSAFVFWGNPSNVHILELNDGK